MLLLSYWVLVLLVALTCPQNRRGNRSVSLLLGRMKHDSVVLIKLTIIFKMRRTVELEGRKRKLDYTGIAQPLTNRLLTCVSALGQVI